MQAYAKLRQQFLKLILPMVGTWEYLFTERQKFTDTIFLPVSIYNLLSEKYFGQSHKRCMMRIEY